MLSFKNHLLLNNIRNLNESSMWLKTVIGGIVIKIRSLDTQIQVSDDANEQNRLLSQQNKLLGYISGLGQGGNYASFDFFSSYFMNTNHAYGVRVNGQVQAAADCIRFIPSSGNIATGEFTLFGVNQ